MPVCFMERKSVCLCTIYCLGITAAARYILKSYFNIGAFLWHWLVPQLFTIMQLLRSGRSRFSCRREKKKKASTKSTRLSVYFCICSSVSVLFIPILRFVCLYWHRSDSIWLNHQYSWLKLKNLCSQKCTNAKNIFQNIVNSVRYTKNYKLLDSEAIFGTIYWWFYCHLEQWDTEFNTSLFFMANATQS